MNESPLNTVAQLRALLDDKFEVQFSPLNNDALQGPKRLMQRACEV